MAPVTVKDLEIVNLNLPKSIIADEKMSSIVRSSPHREAGLKYSGMACGHCIPIIQSINSGGKILRGTCRKNRCCLPSAVPKKAAGKGDFHKAPQCI